MNRRTDELLHPLYNPGTPLKPGRVLFAHDSAAPPLYSYLVDFPRIEIVLDGCYENTLCDRDGNWIDIAIEAGSCLVVPADCWNKPLWRRDVTVLSLLMGQRQLGVSRVTWRAEKSDFENVTKHGCALGARCALASMLRGLTDLAEVEPESGLSHWLLAFGLINHALTLVDQRRPTQRTPTENLLENVRIYLQENFHRPVTRESVARRFNISPNHLSRIFNRHADSGFSSYLASVRLERAKFMLRRYSFHVDEIAYRCGYSDANYFCRVFKQKTGLTPTEYRIAS